MSRAADSRNFSIAILAGGESSRMGRNKALADLGGQPVISYLLDSLTPLAKDTFIVANEVAAYERFGVPVRADHYGFRASLAGIYSAVASAGEDTCLVTACDMPFASPALVEYMYGLLGGYDAVVPVSHRGLEPLHAFYRRECLVTLRDRIDAGDLAIRRALERLKVREVGVGEMVDICDPLRVFFNVNRPEDLQEAEALLAEGETAPAARPWAGASGGRKPPLVCFVGVKNSGKTTFIEKLVPLLVGRGLNIAFIKHDTHGFDMDREGTDTWRIGRAGARLVKISSPAMVASLEQVEREKSLEELTAGIGEDIDLIVVEGYKTAPVDRIELVRSERGSGLVLPEEELIAVISDRPDAAASRPVFDINGPAAVADFLTKKYWGRTFPMFPNSPKEPGT